MQWTARMVLPVLFWLIVSAKLEGEVQTCDASTTTCPDEFTQAVNLFQLSTARRHAQQQKVQSGDVAPGKKVEVSAAGSTTWHVAYVACGEEYFDLNAQLSLASLVAQVKLDHLNSVKNGGPSIRVVIHIVLDEASKKSFDEWIDMDADYWDPIAKYDVHLVHTVLQDQPQLHSLWKRFMDLDPERPCASIDLFFPYFLSDVKDIVYLDSDTRVVGSLVTLFEPLAEPLVWGMSEDAGDNFRVPAYNPSYCHKQGYEGKCYYGRNGLNSGVIRLNLDRYREYRVVHESSVWLDQIESNVLDHKFGDQDVLNFIAQRHKEDGWTEILPCEDNIRPWMALPVTHLGPDVCSLLTMRRPVILHGVAHAFHNLPGWKKSAQRVEEAVERVRQLPWTVQKAVGSEDSLPETICTMANCLNFYWPL